MTFSLILGLIEVTMSIPDNDSLLVAYVGDF